MSYPVRKGWKALHLTSPEMHGGVGGVDDGAVKEAQELLTHNRFQNFKPGVIDGYWGEHSTKRAKHWLGYRKSDINGRFGANVRKYLLPETHPQFKKLPLANHIRREKRLAAYRLTVKRRENIANVQARAFEFNKAHVGYKESPFGSNDNIAGAWYGANGVPWCAIWQTYCWCVGGGYDKGVSWRRGERWSFVPYLVADARSFRNGVELISHIYLKRGDPVAYDWNHDGEADHVEGFDEWISSGISFYAVGGNTGPSDASNGGEVYRSVRYVSEVEAFIRVRA